MRVKFALLSLGLQSTSMSSCCANMTEFAEVTDTLKEMTISDPAPVGDEMTQDDAPVTIGATVPTGFESTAADEVKEKLGCVCKIGKDRGKIYFEIKKERLAEVHRLKSVDNLFVIVEEFTDFYFSEIKEAALEDLKNLAAKLSWERALSTWEMNNSLKKKKKRKKAGNGSKEKKQLTAVPGDESGSPKEEHPATPQPEEALQLDCSDGSSSQPPPAEEIPAGPSSQPPPAEEIPAGPSSQPPPAEAIPAGPSSQPPPAEEIPAGLSSQPPPAEEIPAGPSSQPPPREEIPAGPDSQTSQEAGDEDSVIKSEPPDEGNPDPSHVLKFRVTCSRAGDNHSFTSNDAARDFGGAVQEHFQWKADMKNFDVEVLLNISFTDMVVGIALTEESLHRRNITHFGPTTLRSTLAYGMLRLCNLKPSDVIIDPMCGTGAIPIEGVSEWPSCFFLAGDNNSQAVNRAASNICSLLRKKPSPESVSSGLPIDAVHWDISKLPLRSGSVDVIITDMPFGKRIGSKKKNWDLYPACLREMSRVCRAGTGRAVLLTHDRKCFVKALAKVGHLWKKMYTVWVNIGGLHAGVYLLKRTLPNAEEHSGEAEERVPDLHTTEE